MDRTWWQNVTAGKYLDGCYRLMEPLPIRRATQHLQWASGTGVQIQDFPWVTKCFCVIIHLCTYDDNLHTNLLSSERRQLWRNRDSGIQAWDSGLRHGKGTHRCHCESSRQAAIKSVHKRHLRERKDDLKAFIPKWWRCHLRGRKGLKARLLKWDSEWCTRDERAQAVNGMDCWRGGEIHTVTIDPSGLSW